MSKIETTRSKRKDEHVELALKQTRLDHPYDSMRLKPVSLPSVNVEDVRLDAQYFGHTFSYPFYINAMTGGSDKTLEINRKLSRIAHRYGLAMAVGSQHAALDDVNLEASYRVVREENPDGFVLANVNANATVDLAKRAIAMIEANALQIHINVAQELAMPEGDREFSHWMSNIEAIVKSVKVPVIVKEVGNGLDSASVQRLIQVGVQYVDVSGRGGTNFIWIEDQRRPKPRYPYLNNWGLTALEAVFDNRVNAEHVEIVASGGVRTPLDVVKLLVLGAKAVGLSHLFLELSFNDDVRVLDDFIEDLKHVMVMVNAKNILDLSYVKYKFTEDISWE